jgi:hypothetical protein
MLAALSASCSLVPPLDPVTSPVSAKFLGKTGWTGLSAELLQQHAAKRTEK